MVRGYKKYEFGPASWLSKGAKVLATKLDDLSAVHGNPQVEGEKLLFLSVALRSPHKHTQPLPISKKYRINTCNV